MSQPVIRRVWWAMLAVLFQLFLAPPIRAHNGRQAVALPLRDIVIDGDLSDWPANMPIYAIRENVECQFRAHHRDKSTALVSSISPDLRPLHNEAPAGYGQGRL